jgi:hypothetical protein
MQFDMLRFEAGGKVNLQDIIEDIERIIENKMNGKPSLKITLFDI